MADPESPWKRSVDDAKAGREIFQDAIFEVRRTINRAQAPDEIKQMALDALVSVENQLPDSSADDIRRMGDPASVIFAGVLTIAAIARKDPTLVARIYDSFGKYFPIAPDVLSNARSMATLHREGSGQ